MLAATCLAVFPSIWIVDASNGPGTHFTDLPPAIAAAANGDTILVRSGTYTPFTLTGKGLWIRGAGAATTTVTAPAGSATDVAIAATPAGSLVQLSGLTLQSPTVAGAIGWALEVQNGAEVALVDCIVSGRDQTAVGHGALRVHGGRVHAARCAFRGGNALFASIFGGGHGGDAVRVEAGAGLAGDSLQCEGGDGNANPFGSGTIGGDALVVDTGTATLSRSTLAGGDALLAPWADAGAAVRTVGTAFVRIAGNANEACTAGTSSLGTHTPALVAATGSQVFVHGPIVLAGSTPGGPATGGPVTMASALPRLTISAPTLPSGESNGNLPTSIDLDGLIPGAIFVYTVGDRPALVTGLAPFAVGEILVDLTTATIFVGSLDAAGHLTFPFLAAGSPSLLGVTLHTQPGVFDPATGHLLLGNADVRTFTL